MKIACSSATFATHIRSGNLTQLDWLDLCANELEVDGVVFATEHFPRTDDEYLAQVKKAAADLGLTVAALALEAAVATDDDAETWLDRALALGAPLLIVRAPAAVDDPAAWGAFADAVKARSRAAKRANVTLALANVPGTLCASAADQRRVAKDVDSAWLRFALEATNLGSIDDVAGVLAKTAIATATIEPARFATPDDTVARDVIARLARFRGFVTLETIGDATHDYHGAVARFATERMRAVA